VTSINDDTIPGGGGGGGDGYTTTANNFDLDATGQSAYTGADSASPTLFSVDPSTQTPEPASLSILGLGALALLRRPRHP
jgi:MYXO-CTERM domain-containing protein